MLVEEVLFSLYDRNQNYFKKKVLNFGKEIKTIILTLLMEKTSATPSISPPGGLNENKFIFLWDEWNISSNHQGEQMCLGEYSQLKLNSYYVLY